MRLKKNSISEGTSQVFPHCVPPPSGPLRWWNLRASSLSWRKHRLLLIAVILVAFAGAAFYEMRTSEIQSKVFSAIAARLSFTLGQGPSPEIAFPSAGPLNEIRGYTKLPVFVRRLIDTGFRVVGQARISPGLALLSKEQISPPYEEKPVAGLVIREEHGAVLFDADSRQHVFKSYEEIPQIAVKALLLVENRDLEKSGSPNRNPVVDWGRLVKAGFSYVGNKLGLPLHL